jgi:hypothetical protein
MRTLTRRVAALAVVSTLTLAGCGGSDGDDDAKKSDTGSSSTTDAPDDSDDSDDSGVAPAAGDTITAEGFSFKAPEGWSDAKDVNPSALALAANRQDNDGFADNVNVIADPTIVDADMDTLESSIEKVLKGANAKDVKVEDPIEVGGEEAARISAAFELNGNRYRTEQFAVDHDGKGYVVTFSFSEDVPDADRDELSESVLKTWSWGS